MELWSAERVLVKGKFEKDWGIAVDAEGNIHSVGPRAHLVAGARRVHHYPDKILMPAFVNPHQHGYDRLFRPLTDLKLSYADLIQKAVRPYSGSINRDIFDAVHRVVLAESALAGIGTVGEFFYLHNGAYAPGEAAFAERLIQIAVDMGVRLALVYVFLDQGAGDVKPFCAPMDVSIKEFEDLHQRFGRHPLIRLIPGIHSLAHTSSEAILAAKGLADKYDTPLHVQLAAGQSDIDAASEQYGTTPLKALQLMEVLDKRLVIINGTLLNDEEMDLIKQVGARVILCPTAALARGDQMPRAERLLPRKIPFSIASGTLPMFHGYAVPEEIKALELAQREGTQERNVLKTRMELASLFDLAGKVPANMLNLDTARFMPGAAADFLMVDVNTPASKRAFQDGSQPYIFNELLFGWGTQARVSHVFVQGKMIVANGTFLQDLSAAYRMIERQSAAFMENLSQNGTH